MKSLFDVISIPQSRWAAVIVAAAGFTLLYGYGQESQSDESIVPARTSPFKAEATRKRSGPAPADLVNAASRPSSVEPVGGRDATGAADSSTQPQEPEPSTNAMPDPDSEADDYGRQMAALAQQQQMQADLDEPTALAQSWGLHIDLRLGADLPAATKEQLLGIQAEGMGEREGLDQALAEGRISADEYRGRLADVMRRQGATYAAVLSRDQYIKLMNAAPEEDVSDLLWPATTDEDAPASEGPLLLEGDPENVPPYEIPN